MQAVLGFFKDEPGGRRLPYPGRAVDDDMLGIGTAERGFEGSDAFFLAYDLR